LHRHVLAPLVFNVGRAPGTSQVSRASVGYIARSFVNGFKDDPVSIGNIGGSILAPIFEGASAC
jgi:hypothetical protein